MGVAVLLLMTNVRLFMYTYRRGEKNDIEALIGLLEELTALEEDFDFDAGKHRDGLELLLEAPANKVCVIVAEYSGIVVGMCTGQVVLSTAMGGMSVWVEDVVVSSKHRGRGVGKKMLVELERWARDEAGAKRMQLWADMDNTAAIDFYNKNGWATANGIVLKNIF